MPTRRPTLLSLIQGERTSYSRDHFTDHDLAYLRDHSGKLSLKVSDEHVRLYTRAWAGTIRLTEARLEIQPKMHPERWRQTLFYMLETTGESRTVRFLQPARYTASDVVFEQMIGYFLDELDALIAGGLLRRYERREDRLDVQRGRVVLRDLWRTRLDGKLSCRHFVLSPDAPENRLLKRALNRLKSVQLSRDLSSRASVALEYFSDVSGEPMHRPITYHRLNERYRPAHRLAKLILENLYVGFGPGQTPFHAFLVNMERLFEDFVRTILRSRLPSSFQVSGTSATLEGREGNRIKSISMHPDILADESQGPGKLVLDVKYKTPTTSSRFKEERARSNDFYQILAYATVYQCPGVLIYPQHDFSSAPVRDVFEVDGREIVIATIDLAQSPKLIGSSLCSFLEDHFRLRDMRTAVSA